MSYLTSALEADLKYSEETKLISEDNLASITNELFHTLLDELEKNHPCPTAPLWSPIYSFSLKNTSTAQILTLANALHQNNTMTGLMLIGVYNNDKHLAILMKAIAHNKNLTSLIFYQIGFGSHTAKELFTLMLQNVKLIFEIQNIEKDIHKKGCRMLSDYLLKHDPDHPFLFYNFYRALKALDIPTVKFIISLSIDINKAYEDYGSPLHEAINCHSLELIQLLCESRADVNSTRSISVAKVPKTLTPLQLAMRADLRIKKEILQVLLQHGAKGSKEDMASISSENMVKLYFFLRNVIARNNRYALAHNLTFIIMVGELHIRRQSLLIEIMILLIACELGIMNVLHEDSQAMLEAHKNHQKIKDAISNSLTSYMTYPISMKLGMENYAVDLDHGKHFSTRNKTMSDTIKTLSIKSGVLIIGSAHFKGLLKDYPLGNTFHVLAINSYPRKAYEIDVGTHSEHDHHDLRVFSDENKNILQVKMDGNAELLTPHEILEKTQGLYFGYIRPDVYTKKLLHVEKKMITWQHQLYSVPKCEQTTKKIRKTKRLT